MNSADTHNLKLTFRLTSKRSEPFEQQVIMSRIHADHYLLLYELITSALSSATWKKNMSAKEKMNEYEAPKWEVSRF
jgi:hypothetical protein